MIDLKRLKVSLKLGFQAGSFGISGMQGPPFRVFCFFCYYLRCYNPSFSRAFALSPVPQTGLDLGEACVQPQRHRRSGDTTGRHVGVSPAGNAMMKAHVQNPARMSSMTVAVWRDGLYFHSGSGDFQFWRGAVPESIELHDLATFRLIGFFEHENRVSLHVHGAGQGSPREQVAVGF
jgi:hypothetical protein